MEPTKPLQIISDSSACTQCADECLTKALRYDDVELIQTLIDHCGKAILVPTGPVSELPCTTLPSLLYICIYVDIYIKREGQQQDQWVKCLPSLCDNIISVCINCARCNPSRHTLRMHMRIVRLVHAYSHFFLQKEDEDDMHTNLLSCCAVPSVKPFSSHWKCKWGTCNLPASSCAQRTPHGPELCKFFLFIQVGF